MLFLKRIPNDEGIVIIAPNGEELKFNIAEIKGNQVKLCFESAPGFQIWRGEVWERMKREKI